MNNAGNSEASRKWFPFHQSSRLASNAEWREAAAAAGRALATSGLPTRLRELMSQLPLPDICSSPVHPAGQDHQLP